jgi:cytochrome c-type biogenesis protein CcmF
VTSDVRMAPGQTQHIGGYDFRFDGVTRPLGPNWRADQGVVAITRGNDLVA